MQKRIKDLGGDTPQAPTNTHTHNASSRLASSSCDATRTCATGAAMSLVDGELTYLLGLFGQVML